MYVLNSLAVVPQKVELEKIKEIKERGKKIIKMDLSKEIGYLESLIEEKEKIVKECREMLERDLEQEKYAEMIRRSEKEKIIIGEIEELRKRVRGSTN